MSRSSRWSTLALAVGVLATVQEASAAQLKRVQASSFTMLSGATSTSATLSPAIDPTKSFLVFGVEENAAPPVDGQVSGQITNATTITFQRAAGNTGNIRITWWVAEFASGVRVLRGAATLGPASPGDLTVPLAPAVDPRRSFPLTSMRTVGSSYENSDFARAEITGAGASLSLYLPSGGNSPVVEWQVVEYTDAEVQSGTVAFAKTDLTRTATLPNPVNTSKSWLVYSYECRSSPAPCAGGPPGVIGARLVRGLITNSTTLTFDRSLTTTTDEAIHVTWYMVSFSDATTVQHGSAFFANGNNQVDIPITPVRRGAAIAVAGGAYQRGGRSPYAGQDDHADVAWFAADMTGGVTTLNNLRFNRGFTGASADVGWFVVDFSCCAPLTTVDAGSTLTVTSPDYFELRFNKATGGGIDELFDLAENPTRSNDLAGGIDGIEALFTDALEWGGAGQWYDNAQKPSDAPKPGLLPRLDLLEATPVRVRARAESVYFKEWTVGVTLPGLKAWSDYSIYPSGRVGYSLNRRASAGVTYTLNSMSLGVHLTAGAPLNSWNAYSQSGALGAQAATDNFVLFAADVAGARTDFLQVPHRDWTLGHPAPATAWARFDSGAEEYALISWREFAGTTIPAGTSETWDFLTYFKPVNFTNQLSAAATERRDDFRGPDPLAAFVAGSGWNENTADADFFNESEAAYTLDLNPATGLQFDMDGSATTRHAPFFKIRQWRSFSEAPQVTLEGTALARSLDYRAAVKPLSRAHQASALSWYCTAHDAAACSPPDVGSGGGLVLGNGAIVAGRHGNGLSVATVANDSYFFAPPADFSMGTGAVEFWFKPFFDSTSPGTRMLWFNIGGSLGNYDCVWLQHTGTNLVFRAYLSADNESCNTGGSTVYNLVATTAAPDYSWRAGDWVHIRTEWHFGSFARLLVNQSVVASAGGFSVIGWDVGNVRIGSCQINCPGGTGSSNADGVIDEPHIYFGMGASGNPAPVGHAGLVGDSRESLANPASNVALLVSSVGSGDKGEYLYLGADSRFRGLNVSLATAGAGVAPGALVWQYWRDNGAGIEAWADLESVAGFNDGTADFTRTGTVKWDADPADWKPYTVSGGPDLYYVRVYLSGFPVSYSTPPVERVIKTDILLFQYCKDVTAAAQTFDFEVPPTTEVKLQSFTALAGDRSVLVEWRTASELANLGFHLYRSSSEGGPWEQLTRSLIPGLGSSAVGQAYSYRDTGLANGTRYFYRLEDVDASSKATPHGPVSAVPQAGAAAGGAPGSEPPASGGGRDKKKDAAASCPDWVLSAYASSVGADAATPSLRCTRHGDPEATSFGVLSRDSRSATVELRTGGFYALHTQSGAGGASGTVRVFVPGFDFAQGEQALALPMRRALVDAVVGRRVELGGVRALDFVSFRSLQPSALGSAEMQVGRDGTVRAVRRGLRDVESARSSASRRQAGTPVPRIPTGELARLLPSVFQGETKSAVIELSPLRFDERRGLVLAKRVRVRLLFTGREAGESGRGSVGRAPGSRKPVSGELLARLHTTSRGLYAVSFEQLFPGRPRGFAASQLRLERQGEPVGFHLEPASDAFGPGSHIYFFADRTAGSTDFSAEVVYELVRSRDGLQLPLQSAAPGSNTITSASLVSRSFETNRFYQPGLLDAPDPWLWEAFASGATRAKSFTLSGVDGAASATAELELFLQGASESGEAVDHHLSVSLNGTLVGDAQFAGKQPYRMGLSVPASLLREGANELSLTNVADTGVSSFVFLDRFSLVHPQLPALTRGVFEGTWADAGTASLAGVSGPVVVLDVTAARWLTGLESAGGSLRFDTEAGHRYLAVSQPALLTPRVTSAAASTLRSTQNQADYILIAPRAFLDVAEPLVQRRHDQGLTARAVAFEEIADEFGHGQPSAEAIKAFLAYAFQSWTRPSPRYVLLLGDSTYDPRNFIGTSQPSPLPALWAKTSYLWTVSDPQLAAVNGDDALPDVAIGRLPAATVEQAQALVAKLLAWEDSGQGLSGQAALVADNPDLAGDFEADVADIVQSFFQGRPVSTLKLSELGGATRPAILDALNSGLSHLSYVGHGGAAVWASENVWNSWDAPSLQAQSQQPLLVTMNCLNGYFVAPAFDSLSESLLKAEGRGAIAAFSPSGLSVDGPAHQYHRALMAALTSGQHARLGDAILAAQKTYAETGLMPELLGVYQLLGDPGMVIR